MIIHQLQSALGRVLDGDDDDEDDDDDNKSIYISCTFQFVVCLNMVLTNYVIGIVVILFIPPDEETKLALTYGNACNGILRAVACTYQNVILQRSCILEMPLQ